LGGGLWLSAASALYLAAALATFVLLAARTAPGETHGPAALEAQLAEVTRDIAQAALWPLYWAQHDDLDRLAIRAAERASSIALPHWRFDTD